MAYENVVREKSLSFAKRVIKVYKYLCDDKKEYVISKQLLRSGTSIGANIAETQYASSRKDFVAKLYISLRETSETLYWLELLYSSEYLTSSQYGSLQTDCEELRKLLSSITKTSREKQFLTPNS